jgi:hypothetical protein
MFEHENSHALADKLEYAFGISGNFKSKIISSQKEFALREFGLDRWSSEIIKIYSDICKRAAIN